MLHGVSHIETSQLTVTFLFPLICYIPELNSLGIEMASSPSHSLVFSENKLDL